MIDDRICQCDYDWTDGGDICQECKLPRYPAGPATQVSEATVDE